MDNNKKITIMQNNKRKLIKHKVNKKTRKYDECSIKKNK